MIESERSVLWHDAVATLLSDLIVVQETLLVELSQCHRRLPQGNEPPLAVTTREAELFGQLAACYQRRAELLRAAGEAGLPAQSLRAAVGALGDRSTGQRLSSQIARAESAGERLRLASSVQWMLAQRSLVHVGQLLEILATGVPQPPTYGNGPVSSQRGGLLDQAA